MKRLGNLQSLPSYSKTFLGPPEGIQVERDDLNKYGRHLYDVQLHLNFGYPLRTVVEQHCNSPKLNYHEYVRGQWYYENISLGVFLMIL